MNKNLIFNKEKNYISFSKLSENDIINLFTVKPYNFRKGIVSDNEIKENYDKLQNDLNHKFYKIKKPIQTHTNIVKIVDENNIDDNFEDVDGLITDMKNVALVTSLADCQGILLYDKEKEIIGNIHSGWKGTLNRIGSNAIKLMNRHYDCNLENIEVYICPSILGCCFEVDEDVKILFENEFTDIDITSCIKKGDIKDNKQKYYIDTVKINKLVFINLGIKKDNIVSSNICSKCNNNIIHSHRTEGINSGRNISIICMK